MALPLAPLAAVSKFVLDLGVAAALTLSYLWERSSLTAAIHWAPVVASFLAPALASACSFVSAAYMAVPLLGFVRFVGFAPIVRFVRFAIFVAQTILVLPLALQLVIVLILSYAGLVVCLFIFRPFFAVRKVFRLFRLFRFLPRCVRAHPFFWFTQILRFARCANSIRVALSQNPAYRYIAMLPLVYRFSVATYPYVATAFKFLYGKICSTVKAVQALLRRSRRAATATTAQAAPVTTSAASDAAVSVPVLDVDVELLLRRAQSNTARRHARKAAKKARASTTARSVTVQAPTRSLLEKANASTARRHASKSTKKAAVAPAALATQAPVAPTVRLSLRLAKKA